MNHLDLANLSPLMARTIGIPEIKIGLLDGPVLIGHSELATENIREVPGKLIGACSQASSIACRHGTLVAGVLSARRGSAAPAICPGCTLLVRPIFGEATSTEDGIPRATPEDLARAIVSTIEAGARILNLSASVIQVAPKGENQLQSVLNYAAQRGVVTVAAAGNQSVVGSTAITRHAGVVPVAACDLRARPMNQSNIGNSIGRRGLLAPGDDITSLGTEGNPGTFSGTSAAAPFVTGAVALLWSEFPDASAAQLLLAVRGMRRQKAIVPPLLNAWSAHQFLLALR